MPRFACPVCHDPHAYPIWLDSEPPNTCPNEPHLTPGRGICAAKLNAARQAAAWRKAAPECFDANGNMLPGRFDEVLRKVGDPHA